MVLSFQGAKRLIRFLKDGQEAEGGNRLLSLSCPSRQLGPVLLPAAQLGILNFARPRPSRKGSSGREARPLLKS
jgi:hypothetical protein